jgi:hypothetical protein
MSKKRESIDLYKRKHTKTDELVKIGTRAKRGSGVRFFGKVYKIHHIDGKAVIHL